MKQLVSDFIKKHHLFHDHATILVGVSGGPDSMALLHYLNAVKNEHHYRIIALVVDHQLRGEESKKDVAYVESICKQWDIEVFSTSVDVSAYKKREKLGTQLAARELRYQFFAQSMETLDADYITLAHHGDDQAETMIMRFTRGTNPQALKGIPVKRRFATGYLVRPFLCLSKETIEAYCAEHSIQPRLDPSNQQDVYTRNFIRLHVLPLLKEKNPALHKSLQRLSENITQEDLFLEDEARKMVKAVVRVNEFKKATFKINDFIQYPYALQRRAFHLILNYLYHKIPKGLSYGHDDQFFELIHSNRANASIDLPMNLRITKQYSTISLHYPATTPTGFQIELDVPGNISLPDGSCLTASITTHPIANNKFVMSFPVSEQTNPQLIIRTRQPGDRIRVKGLNGTKKVKDIFIDKKVPLDARDNWPIITDKLGNILWLVGLAKGTVCNEKEWIEPKCFINLEYTEDNM